MKLDMNMKTVGDVLRQVLLLLVSIVCIYLLVSQLKSEKKVKVENTNIEKLEKRITTIEGLIMTQQLQILENSLTPPPPKPEREDIVPPPKPKGEEPPQEIK